jgi:isopentenyl-diphosphate delta-isomerase
LRVIATALVVTLFDLVLDPGAIRLGFWQYAGGGWFYGVPMSDFAGWLASGFVGSVIIELLLARFKPLLPTPAQLGSSVIFIIFFWSAIAAHGGLIAPALLGSAIFATLVPIYFKKRYSFDDKIVFVDESNTPIATGDKLPSHNSDTRLHRAFSIFLFNSSGEFLMQQRALSKKTWPGVWSNSCCGHVMLHETIEAAAQRRLKHELGLKSIELTNTLPEFRYRAEKDGVVENEICPVFVGFTQQQPKINPDEVEATKWVDWNEFVASLDNPDTDISPWAIKEVRELLASRVFNELYTSTTSGRG